MAQTTDLNAPNREPDPGQALPQDQRAQNQNEQDSRTPNLDQLEDEAGNTEDNSKPNGDPPEGEDEPTGEDEGIESEAEDEETTDDNSSEAEDSEPDESDSSDIPILELESVPSIDDDAPIPIDQTPLQTDDEDNGSLTTADPELGVLILQEREPSISRPQQETPVFLSGKLSFFDTDNAFSGLDPVNDQLWQFGVSVSATPTLGPRTLLIAEAEGTLVRYSNLSDLDYNEISLQTSLWHVFASGFYGEVGWQNRQLFANDDGDRFLDEHSLQTRLFYRTQFTDDLRLDTYYQLRVSFTTPKDRSRILNRLVTSLTYDLTPDVEVGLIYLLSYTDYTQTERQDLSNQISAQISYEFSPRNKISLFSGYSFGDSTDSDISFNNFIFGATVNVGVRLF